MTTRLYQESAGEASGVEGGEAASWQGSRTFPELGPDIIDQAVDEVFREANVDPTSASIMRNLMSTDPDSTIARAYHHSKIGAGLRGNLGVLGRKPLSVKYVLTETQAARLVKYAPEFTLRFDPLESHDHPSAAACRIVDRALLESRIPPGVFYTDVGGNPGVHVENGNLGLNVHACCPLVDPKDPGRAVHTRLRMKKLCADKTVKDAVRSSAEAFLRASPIAVCNKRAQLCSVQSKVLISCHVYDIPMEDWPAIMSVKGAQLVEGCLLYPKALLHTTSGDMAVAGARYEVDVDRDEFRMGFVDSPSWWYSHRFSDYLKYGVDQIIRHGNKTYSYKVVERRGDTIFFRILRIANTVGPVPEQTYKVPGVPLVEVRGYDLSQAVEDHGLTRRRVWLFPKPLWEDMLNKAKEMFERNSLSHERLYNYYRTVAPRQTINGVLVSGGYTVAEHNELTPLIVHVVIAAAQEVLKSRAESTQMIDASLVKRRRHDEWTVYKVLAALGATVAGVLKVPILPLLVLSDYLKQGMDAINLCKMVDWEVQASVRVVNMKLLLADKYADSNVVLDDDFGDEYLSDTDKIPYEVALREPELANQLLSAYADVLPVAYAQQLSQLVKAADDMNSEPASESSDDPVSVVKASSEHSQAIYNSELGITTGNLSSEARDQAILEAIAETELEAVKVEASCADRCADLMLRGEPDIRGLTTKKEMYNNPDLWFVSKGVIEKSASGTAVEDFEHAAVFVPCSTRSTRLMKIYESEYNGMSMGVMVSRMHFKINDPEYTGWVYVDDSLMVHNGDQIADAMRAALNSDRHFSVVLHQGPPGCGKTYAIEQMADPKDVFLVPGRLAAKELSSRLADKSKELEQVCKKRVKTLDSYLVNCMESKAVRALKTDRLVADEVFMSRAGRWYAAAVLLGAKEIHAYGDVRQIPHIPRAECAQIHLRIQPTVVDHTWITYRCPAELVACWGERFNWRVRSVSSEVGSVKHVSMANRGNIPKGCVMMGAYQADKKALREMYKGCGTNISVMTIHESEGKTFDHVWLHRFDNRRRTDKFSLYDKESYALVAMSRSRKTFTYVAPDLGDLVSQWIKKGQDPRRIAAAKDIASAGIPMEML